MSNNGFTPIQQAMIDVLNDGKRHTREELHACLLDDLGPLKNIQPHITAIRKKLQPRGHDLLCEYYQRNLYYRRIRLIAN